MAFQKNELLQSNRKMFTIIFGILWICPEEYLYISPRKNSLAPESDLDDFFGVFDFFEAKSKSFIGSDHCGL